MFLNEVQKKWEQGLAEIYDQREVKNIFSLVLEDMLAISKSEFFLNNRALFPNELTCLDEVFLRLSHGEPVQQIIGFTYFDDLKISVSKDVLIPRPETEELIAWICEHEIPDAPQIIDLCTGSGCIALALKKRIQTASVSGIDVSEPALVIANKNAQSLRLKVDFHKHDVLGKDEFLNQYDIMVSNPPYIPENEQRLIAKNVLMFEPSIALFVSSADPLLFYRRIAELAQESLKSSGFLFFEVHELFAIHVKEMLQNMGFVDVEIKKDLQEKDRMIKARKGE